MSLDPLADVDDLEARLGRELSAEETAKAEQLLVDASASVRGYTGQQFTLVTNDEVRLRPRNGYVRLPQRPVNAVDSVEDIDDNEVLYVWEGLDRVRVSPNVPDTFAWEPWGTGIPAVDVVYDHGYAEIPDDIVAVVCSVVLRAMGTDPLSTGVQQESIAGYSYSVGSAAAAGGLGLLPGERETLDRYRSVGGTAWVTP